MKMLVADDDAIVRQVLKAALERRDHEICEATSGPQAWQQLSGPDPPRLAIVDWMMPGMSGPELCRKLKSEFCQRGPYLILLTTKNDQRDIVEGLNSGAEDFMGKPFDLGELHARVNVGVRTVELQESLREAKHQLEERVRRRTREVERLLRRQEELLDHLSHDLRTPLTPLLSTLGLLEETETDPERREMLRLAVDGARGMRMLTTGVLDVCRAGAFAPVFNPQGEALRDLVSGALAQCEAERDLEERSLANEIPQGLRVPMDAVQVGRVLACLLNNAVTFTAKDGRIGVRATAADAQVTISVSDNGLGLEACYLADIFEPFHKVDASRHNLGARGLGLTIARSIVERCGGSIWAESAGRGHGSTFSFTLPSTIHG